VGEKELVEGYLHYMMSVFVVYIEWRLHQVPGLEVIGHAIGYSFFTTSTLTFMDFERNACYC